MDVLSPKTREDLRFKCQTDLYFLAKDILKKDLIEPTHRPVTDFFVQKDPRKSLSIQDAIKERLLLYPRGSYKSTLNICDCVQWIICFPDIRILVLTGADDLATSFVDELKDYFIEADPPTMFQHLFPEHVLQIRDKGNAGEFRTPAQSKRTREPTVFASSIMANNSGWHVDVLKADDVVTDRNTDSVTEMQRVTRKFKMVRKLLMPWGYRDTIGTPYSVFDCYADHMEAARTYQEKFRRPMLKYLRRPAWWIKGSDYALPTVQESEHEENLELLFPEALTWAFLRKEQHTDEHSFNSQYLCNPIEANQVVFTIDELRRHTLPYHQLPRDPKYYVTWDFAFSTKKGRDYSVGAVGAVDEQNRVYVVDMVRGRFLPDELAFQVAKLIAQYKPEITGIENTVGAKFLEMDIARHCAAMGVSNRIEWFTISTAAQGKEIRVKELQAMMAQGQLWFSSQLRDIDTVYKEFIQFGGPHHHDDIPDAISHLRRYLPGGIIKTSTEKYEMAVKRLKDKEMHDLIYGLGQYEEKPAPPPVVIPTVASIDGLEYPILEVENPFE